MLHLDVSPFIDEIFSKSETKKSFVDYPTFDVSSSFIRTITRAVRTYDLWFKSFSVNERK